MIRDKKKWLYGVGIFILIIALATIGGNLKKKQALSPKVELSPFTEIEIDKTINQTGQNTAIESVEKKVEEFEDPLFNDLVEKDVSEMASAMKWDLELISNMESMKESDRTITKKFDLPRDVLGETPTDKLFSYFIRTPLNSFLYLYSQEEVGVQRLLNASSTLHEFYMRKDMVEGALKMYREYDLSPKSMSDKTIIAKYSYDKRVYEDPRVIQQLAPENITDTKIANICLNLMAADMIMLSPQFFPKTKGYEIEFLKGMVDRYETVVELGKIYDEDKFGAAISRIPPFCLSLAENLDKEFYTKLKGIKPTSAEFIEEIKNYLENQGN